MSLKKSECFTTKGLSVTIPNPGFPPSEFFYERQFFVLGVSNKKDLVNTPEEVQYCYASKSGDLYEVCFSKEGMTTKLKAIRTRMVGD